MVVCECDLDVSVFRNVFYAFVHEVKKIAGKTKEGFNELCLFSNTNLLAVVFKEESQHLANSNDEGTESDRTEMISVRPVESTSNCS